MATRICRKIVGMNTKILRDNCHRITLWGQFQGFPCHLNQMDYSHKRQFSRSLCKPSQQTRFTITSLVGPPPPQGKDTSPQKNDSSSLDRLAVCNEVYFIQKDFNVEEIGNNTRKKYTYEIKDSLGEKLFDAVHIYDTCPPKFDFKLYGPNGSLLIGHKLLQNLSSHLLSMQIIRPGGMYVGSIEEVLDPDKPVVFELRDSRDEVQAVVLTDFANTSFGFNRVIKILAPDRSTVIGKVSKKWGFNDKLTVCIRPPNPTHMNVQFRASLIGLCILLVNNYYFQSQMFHFAPIQNDYKLYNIFSAFYRVNDTYDKANDG